MLEFNRRLREHFEAFVIDAHGAAVPIWKVELPAPLARHVAETVEPVGAAAYLRRRVAELGLLEDTLSEKGPDTQP